MLEGGGEPLLGRGSGPGGPAGDEVPGLREDPGIAERAPGDHDPGAVRVGPHRDDVFRVVEALDIPVIGNGDITAAEDVVAMRAHTNCAGVMIARGAFGNPWIFTQARDLVAGRPARPAPSPEERFATALEHARLALRLQGDTRKTALEFRKHFGWDTKAAAGGGRVVRRRLPVAPHQPAGT